MYTWIKQRTLHPDHPMVEDRGDPEVVHRSCLIKGTQKAVLPPDSPGRCVATAQGCCFTESYDPPCFQPMGAHRPAEGWSYLKLESFFFILFTSPIIPANIIPIQITTQPSWKRVGVCGVYTSRKIWH